MKTILKLFAGLVLVLGLGGVVTLQSAINDARAEHRTLTQQSTDGSKVNRTDAPATEAGDEATKLRDENKELPKLRNEVRQLRRQMDEMAKLRADNQRLQGQIKNGAASSGIQYPPDYIRKSALVDAGFSTPEAAVQTFIWAMTHGDINRLKASMSPEGLADLEQQGEENMKKGMVDAAAAIPGYRIVSKEQVSPDEVTVRIVLAEPEDEGQPMKLKLVGNEWKVKFGR